MKVNIDGKEFIVSMDTSTGNIYFDINIKDVPLRYFFMPMINGYESGFYTDNKEKRINGKHQHASLSIFKTLIKVPTYFFKTGWKEFVDKEPTLMTSRIEEPKKINVVREIVRHGQGNFPGSVMVEHSYQNEIVKGNHVYNRWFYLIKPTSPDFDKSFIDNQDKIYVHHYLDKYRGMRLSFPKPITREQDKEFTESIKRELNENV